MGEQKPRQRKFAPRSRQGCLTCRARRKRCDGKRPDCQNCTRLNLVCEWQSQRQIVHESSSSSPQPSPLPSDSLIGPLRSSMDLWDDLPKDEAAERKHLLRYYVEAFVPSVSVATTPSSFYTSLYIPWAFESTGMLDAIMALSSAQLARRTSNTDRALHLRSLSAKHQRKCHAFLADRVPRNGGPPRDAYQVIGIILLLVGLEALNGEKSTRWLSQMKCVRGILGLLSRDQNTFNSWEVDSLRRHFTYHNAMASLMAKVSKRDAQSSAESCDMSVACPPEGPLTVDPLMGISYYLCGLISRIQYVTSASPAFPAISEAAFNSIERDLQEWRYGSPFDLPGVDLPIALDLVALAESYRLAALIQLYRTSETHKSLIPSCASRAMEFMSRIPPGSPAESSMLYPIFLAGAELNDEPEISKCFKRLAEIQARNRYENIINVQKVLEEVWRPVLNGAQKRDWEDVLQEWGWSFTLG
ncbi:putative Zn(II)2Cys6 transcription factor-like protein [Trematosphaeria pertusa]|uniref:Putative Zn(II)2Cys6 transcription factor-like protein n=1 Tax=Trematosphaeria pertusa TaxID=390896 RepID=A0A6A6IEQ1_9PLEO|nr:putative Zn(II)2Cys6 transcription factor-like protein [Trematosphaeria pertusa]KAF2248548.1 putative Zn(II)2Cys6 transcription factor-like protein [Trematosphaeria pertusa]